MEHSKAVTCPHCHQTDIRKNGSQRWRCNDKANCGKSFQDEYKYNAHKKGVKEQIIIQTLNSSGVRTISRNLKIAKGTVIST